jgi:hypothetical protein
LHLPQYFSASFQGAATELTHLKSLLILVKTQWIETMDKMEMLKLQKEALERQESAVIKIYQNQNRHELTAMQISMFFAKIGINAKCLTNLFFL